MQPELIKIDLMRNWFELNLMKPPTERDFLSQIIYQGKIMYALDAIFPSMEDHLKIRYTSSQLKWCEESEASISRKNYRFCGRRTFYHGRITARITAKSRRLVGMENSSSLYGRKPRFKITQPYRRKKCLENSKIL